MPDLEWDLESSVGDRKITNSHISTLIGYRFKVLSAPFALTMPLLWYFVLLILRHASLFRLHFVIA